MTRTTAEPSTGAGVAERSRSRRMYEPGFSDGAGAQGIWFLPATSGTGWLEIDGGADAVAVHDLEGGGKRLVGDEIENRAAPGPCRCGG